MAQNNYACDASSQPVSIDSEDACGFCALGAILKVIDDPWSAEGQEKFHTTRTVLNRHVPWTCSIPTYNDLIAESKQDILDIFDMTIAKM